MRFLLADDHAILRSGLRRLLEDEFPGVSIEEVGSCEELTTRLADTRFNLLVLDISMGGQSSLGVLPDIRKAYPSMPVLVLSMYGERQFVVRALRNGAAGYLTKERAPDELLRAVRVVLDGRRYISEAIAELIADHVAADLPDVPHEALSEREYEVFLALASARSVSEIAASLNLSVKTVSTYRARILDKMMLETNAHLMQYAIRHGLVT